jgi:hypothetical protein
MKLNNSLVLHTSVAALMVIFGVIVKNASEQMKMPNHPVAKPLGMALFVLGWIYTAYVLSLYKHNKLVFIIPSLAILGSVIMMKQSMSKDQSPPIIYPIVFALSWLVLGFNVGNHLPGNMKYFGLVASAFVLLSMMKMLPEQRKDCIVDGPGMPLFVIAWAIIVFLNGSR